MNSSVDVLIVGAGTTGLTLACDLQRRGVDFELIDAAPGPLPGSRAKAVQPRTLEVADDLGVLPELDSCSMLYPPIGKHSESGIAVSDMYAFQESTDDVPHANTLLLAQYDTDAAFRHRLAALGGGVRQSSKLVDLVIGSDGVEATIDTPDGERRIAARYLVGADGGGSPTRNFAGVAFEGNTVESDRILIADVILDGVSRDYWHMWPGEGGRRMSIVPLPGGVKFQLMVPLAPDQNPELTPESIERLTFEQHTGDPNVKVKEIFWSTVWRQNVRLADRYRVGPVFLAGDAAHVHPPTGGQGMNTGIQDSYNLGWKLGQVLAGAAEQLLDTYEIERRPVAERVLGRAKALLEGAAERGAQAQAPARGEEERQLTLSYSGRGLAVAGDELEGSTHSAGVRAGDRAPDAPFVDESGIARRVHETLRGPHFTLLAIGRDAVEAGAGDAWPDRGADLVVVPIPDPEASLMKIYGVDGPLQILVRPDGYVAYVLAGAWHAGLAEYATRVAPR